MDILAAIFGLFENLAAILGGLQWLWGLLDALGLADVPAD
jgi:hypothetical protein